MEQELITELITAIREGVSLDIRSLTILFGLMLLASLSSIVFSYLKTKGQNLATKEDISEITQKVESIRSLYAKRLEYLSYQNQLSMAAMDRRLEKHQEAYSLWWKLYSRGLHEQDEKKIARECQEWWHDNRVFLNKESSEAFLDAFSAAFMHDPFLRRDDPDGAKENWEKIESAGAKIVQSVGLPSFGKRAYEIDKQLKEPEKSENEESSE